MTAQAPYIVVFVSQRRWQVARMDHTLLEVPVYVVVKDFLLGPHEARDYVDKLVGRRAAP